MEYPALPGWADVWAAGPPGLEPAVSQARFFLPADPSPHPLRDQSHGTQAGEEIEKAVIRRLVVEKSQLAALAHISDDFDRAAKVCIRMPCRNEGIEVWFDKMIFPGDLSP